MTDRMCCREWSWREARRYSRSKGIQVRRFGNAPHGRGGLLSSTSKIFIVAGPCKRHGWFSDWRSHRSPGLDITIDAGNSRRRQLRCRDRACAIILVSRESIQSLPHARIDRPRLSRSVRLYSQPSRRLGRRSSASLVYPIVSLRCRATRHVMGCFILYSAHSRLEWRQMLRSPKAVIASMVSTETKLLGLLTFKPAAIQPEALTAADRRRTAAVQVPEIARSLRELACIVFSTGILIS